jgi:hypothetical protein
MSFEHYAQRLLNPFRGAMHTVRFQSAEAVTLDGLNWDIYVANDQLRQGLDNRRQAQISDIRYGSWSPDKGLKRGPLYPSDDFRRMEAMGAVVYEHLVHVHDSVPFGFADRFELWLLDTAGQPLALLHSAVAEQELDTSLPIDWRAGLAAHERFASAAMAELDGGGAGEYLTRYVNTRAGETPSAQWFRRDDDGSGSAMLGVRIDPALDGRRLAANAFPKLGLATTGHNDAHRRLIEDFQAWQAVWLLVLPGLDASTRQALEQQVRLQCQLVESQYRLYPDIIDEGAIQAALVEAILRRSQPAPAAGKKDDPLSTFYIELNPTGGE